MLLIKNYKELYKMVKVLTVSVDEWVYNTIDHRISEMKSSGKKVSRSAYVRELLVKGLLIVDHDDK